ncbi:MAG: hypothetical protein QNK03_06315 [Myxococcota bacterium]|nr:hypothetical protein [Myxococcota bacterium]
MRVFLAPLLALALVLGACVTDDPPAPADGKRPPPPPEYTPRDWDRGAGTAGMSFPTKSTAQGTAEEVLGEVPLAAEAPADSETPADSEADEEEAAPAE